MELDKKNLQFLTDNKGADVFFLEGGIRTRGVLRLFLWRGALCKSRYTRSHGVNEDPPWSYRFLPSPKS